MNQPVNYNLICENLDHKNIQIVSLAPSGPVFTSSSFPFKLGFIYLRLLQNKQFLKIII